MTTTERPYLTGRVCGRCIVPLEISEHLEGGWLLVSYRCPRCGFRQTISFSPAELEEWKLRRRGGRASSASIGGPR